MGGYLCVVGLEKYLCTKVLKISIPTKIMQIKTDPRWEGREADRQDLRQVPNRVPNPDRRDCPTGRPEVAAGDDGGRSGLRLLYQVQNRRAV